MRTAAPQATAGTGGSVAARTAALAAAVDALVAVDVAAPEDAAVRAELAATERALRRLQSRNCELAAGLTRRAAQTAAAERPDDMRAPERASREAQRQLASDLNWTPSQAKRTVTTGEQLEGLDQARAAFSAGDVTGEHARVLADTLAHFVGDQRTALEGELVTAARGQDAVAFGRTCRARLAELDQAAAVRDERRRHGRRYARAAQTPDGMTALSGLFAGLDAEVVHTAIHAFRRPDIAGEHRRPEQRTADAIVAAFRAALDAGTAPQRHGVRPHLNITLDWRALTAESGVAHAGWTGPLPVADILHALDDVGVARILTGPDSLPLDVGRATRSTPAGVWRGIVARDGTCTFDGCDAPPEWCDAAHLDRRWWQGAGTSVTEQALACRPHHRKLDRERWTGVIVGGRVVWHPPPNPLAAVEAGGGGGLP